jgi:hypothetical protein
VVGRWRGCLSSVLFFMVWCGPDSTDHASTQTFAVVCAGAFSMGGMPPGMGGRGAGASAGGGRQQQQQQQQPRKAEPIEYNFNVTLEDLFQGGECVCMCVCVCVVWVGFGGREGWWWWWWYGSREAEGARPCGCMLCVTWVGIGCLDGCDPAPLLPCHHQQNQTNTHTHTHHSDRKKKIRITKKMWDAASNSFAKVAVEKEIPIK